MHGVNHEGLLKECVGMRHSEYLKSLKKELIDVTDRLVMASDEKLMFTLQGQARTLRTQISEIEGSKAALTKWQQPKRGKQM
jgi:septum formation topological specificity factor MinE